MLALMGFDPGKEFHDYGRVAQWLADGADPDLDIYPVVKRLMGKRMGRGPPRTLNYFDSAIADAMAARTKPMPKGNPNERHREIPGQHRRKATHQDAIAGALIALGREPGHGEVGTAGERSQRRPGCDP